MEKIIYRALIITSIILFIASLTQESYTVNGGASIGSFGLIALLLGWMNASLSILCWLANPCFILTLVFLKSKKTALVLSSLAFILSISFLFIDQVLSNEAGHTGRVDGYLSGYWLWVGSHFLLFLVMALKYRNDSIKEKLNESSVIVS